MIFYCYICYSLKIMKVREDENICLKRLNWQANIL